MKKETNHSLQFLRDVSSLLAPPPTVLTHTHTHTMLLCLSTSRPLGAAPARRPAPARATCSRVRSTPNKSAEHFEPADVKVGECLLEDAR